jgi:hypothetical protein
MKRAKPEFRCRRVDPRPNASTLSPLSQGVGEYGLIRSWRSRLTSFATIRTC